VYRASFPAPSITPENSVNIQFYRRAEIFTHPKGSPFKFNAPINYFQVYVRRCDNIIATMDLRASGQMASEKRFTWRS
jgi:hypothetical protein